MSHRAGGGAVLNTLIRQSPEKDLDLGIRKISLGEGVDTTRVSQEQKYKKVLKDEIMRRRVRFWKDIVSNKVHILCRRTWRQENTWSFLDVSKEHWPLKGQLKDESSNF